VKITSQQVHLRGEGIAFQTGVISAVRLERERELLALPGMMDLPPYCTGRNAVDLICRKLHSVGHVPLHDSFKRNFEVSPNNYGYF